MRALFISSVSGAYLETKTEADAKLMRDALYLEVTGDLEDEAAFQQQATGEEGEDDFHS